MKRFACHVLLLPGGSRLLRCVVTVGADGCLREWHVLQGEEPFVEWWGGVFVVLPWGERPDTYAGGMAVRLAGWLPLEPGRRYVVWQAVGQPVEEPDILASARFEKVM